MSTNKMDETESTVREWTVPFVATFVFIALDRGVEIGTIIPGKRVFDRSCLIKPWSRGQMVEKMPSRVASKLR